NIDVIIANYKGGNESVQSLLAGNVTANIGDDFVRASLSDNLTCLFLGSDVKSPRWPQAPSMSSVLTPYGIDTPSPSFLSRYGIYAASAEWAQKNSDGYKLLQKALLDARQTSTFQDYLIKNKIEDLSVG